MVLFVGRRLFGAPAGLYAAAVLAGSPLYVMLGQINTLDMGLTFFLCGAVFAFALGHMFLFWAACALAVLSKGLIGIVLPLATIAFYILIKRDWALLGKMKIFSGGALFLAIAAPWFIAVSLANDEFLRFFFIQEHFQRFTTEMHGRAHPVWYFLPILAAGMAPWLLPLGFTLFHSVKSKAERFDAVLFVALWALVVFAFFSASGSKLPSYILPVFPPLALLIGRWLAASDACGARSPWSATRTSSARRSAGSRRSSSPTWPDLPAPGAPRPRPMHSLRRATSTACAPSLPCPCRSRPVDRATSS